MSWVNFKIFVAVWLHSSSSFTAPAIVFLLVARQESTPLRLRRACVWRLPYSYVTVKLTDSGDWATGTWKKAKVRRERNKQDTRFGFGSFICRCCIDVVQCRPGTKYTTIIVLSALEISFPSSRHLMKYLRFKWGTRVVLCNTTSINEAIGDWKGKFYILHLWGTKPNLVYGLVLLYCILKQISNKQTECRLFFCR